MNQDLPIKPNQEYLEKFTQKEKVVVPHTDFLRKSNLKYLRCVMSTVEKKKNEQVIKHNKSNLTKRQVYENIKQQNQKLKKQDVDSLQEAQEKAPEKKQKIVIAKSQIKKNEQNRNQIKINIEQKSKITKPEPLHEKKNVAVNQIKNNEEDQKRKYQKLLIELNKEREQLQKEKREFQEKRQYLQFKKSLKSVDGLNLNKAITNSNLQPNRTDKIFKQKTPGFIKKNTITSSKSIEKPVIVKKTKDNVLTGTKRSLQSEFKHQSINFTAELLESKKLIDNLTKQIEKIQVVHSKQMKNFLIPVIEFSEDGTQLKKHTLLSIHKIQDFNIRSIGKSIDISQLDYRNNPYYKDYIKMQKENPIKVYTNQQHQTVKVYNNQCKQTLTKKCRVFEFPNGYKLTLYLNQDIKQQLPSQDPIIIYYAKGKDLVKINFNLNFQIFNFLKLNQIQIHYTKQQKKEIRYSDGLMKVIDKNNKEHILADK